jgi:hypothetical protein
MRKNKDMPLWEQRQISPPSIYDNLIMKSIEQANGQYDGQGRYATLIVTGCEDISKAAHVISSLRYAAFRHFVSLTADKQRRWDGKYDVQFTVINKQHARRHIRERKRY